MQELTEQFIKKLLKTLPENGKREGLSKTPRRVASAFEKMLSGYGQDPKDVLTVFQDETYDEMIVIKDIDFFSLCEHHLLPFFGKAYVGYIPNGKIIGLSKIPRLVDMYARRLQNQERLTSQIAKSLSGLVKPKGVGVILEAQHLCMMARGVEKRGTTVVTSAMHGLFKKELNTRSEFLRLIGK